MDYVSKDRDGSAVVRAAREVAAGRRHLDDALGARVLFETTPFDQLSPRQLEVALLMVQGKCNADIALARLAMDCGLIPPAGDGSAFRSNRSG